MKNHLLEKLHPNLTGGTPLNIFKILKNLIEKRYGAFKIWRGKKIQKKIKLTNGAPHPRCAVTNFSQKNPPNAPPLWTAFSVLEKIKENDGNVKKIK